jgi:high-affinity iron transporter
MLTAPAPVFFIVFRETLETAIIVSVLLAFLKQTLGPEMDAVTYKKLVRQVLHRPPPDEN